MASAVEKDLEEQLVEAGNKLRKPPAELDELRRLLEVLENCLGRVEQSPSKSMSTALCPSMKSLVTPALLRHSDKDVRLSVATCLSEITRITAPDAPYDDELMKEIFQMIVATFEDLSEINTPSFAKRVLILETVAKVRSCVVMLDLECDDLIIEMFRHFCKTVREDHAECVYSSMEAIMTVVLEESEDIQLELINVLLDKLKLDNQEALPIARKLVEKVMNSCAAKLKPYLMEVIKSKGASMNDYSKIVAQICEGPAEEVQHPEKDGNNVLGNASSIENTQKAEAEQENVRSGAAEDAETSANPKLSNGSLTSAKEDSSKEDESQKRKSSHVRIKKVAPDSEVASEHPDQQDSKSEAVPRHATKRTKARKPNFSKNSGNASNDSRKIPEDKAVEQSKVKKRRMKENERSATEGPSVKEAKLAAESRKETSATTMHSPTQSNAGPHKKFRGKSAHKEDAKADSEMPALPRHDVGTLSGDSSKEQSSDGKGSKSDKEVEPRKSSEIKPSQRSSKKTDSLNDDEGASTKKRRGRRSNDLKEKVDDHRRIGDPGNKKSFVGKKSVDVTPKDGKMLAKGSSVKKASGRKKDEAAGSTGRVIAYDESLVGSRIKVWWPLDKTFYEGFIVSYDSTKKKHKVSYADGDEEDLVLSKERWNIVQAEEKEAAGHSASEDSDDALAVTPSPKKKVKTSESSGRGKQVKVDTPSKKRKDTPAIKSRGSTSKSSWKSQPNGSSVRGKSSSGKAQGSDIKGKKRQQRSRG